MLAFGCDLTHAYDIAIRNSRSLRWWKRYAERQWAVHDWYWHLASQAEADQPEHVDELVSRLTSAWSCRQPGSETASPRRT